jgi:hypothetical protein
VNPFAYLRDKFVIGCARRMMARHAGRLPAMAVVTGDYASMKALLQGCFEDLQLALLERHVLPKIARRALCLDIGANIGHHSVSFSRAGSTAGQPGRGADRRGAGSSGSADVRARVCARR